MNEKEVIICGLAPQGLFLLREFAKSNYLVHAISLYKSPGYYSKYGKKYLANSYPETVDILKNLHSKLPKTTKCIVPSGRLLTYFIREFPDIYNYFDVESTPFESIEIFIDKNKTYKHAADLDIKYPRVFNLNEITNDDFPIFVKKRNEIKFSDESFKTKIIYSQQEINSLLKNFSVFERQFLVFQEYIPNALNVSFLGYFRKGNLIGFLVVQQIRQYPKGITSCVVEFNDKRKNLIKEKSELIIGSYPYTGFAEVEFKITKENLIYLIEVNPRICGWGKAFKYKFLNFRDFIDQFIEVDNFTLIENKKPVAWLNLLRDLIAIFNSKKIKRLNKIFSTHYDLFEVNDLKPFLMQIVNKLKS